MTLSPSLRGSGLKSLCSVNIVKYALVSLFTREWIEIVVSFSRFCITNVSLFTREWIEIVKMFSVSRLHSVSLFTREWIEMKKRLTTYRNIWTSPSLRGSGLKFSCQSCKWQRKKSPSLRGSGLKSTYNK